MARQAAEEEDAQLGDVSPRRGGGWMVRLWVQHFTALCLWTQLVPQAPVSVPSSCCNKILQRRTAYSSEGWKSETKVPARLGVRAVTVFEPQSSCWDLI